MMNNPTAAPPTIKFQGVVVYQIQALKNVYHCAKHEEPLTHVELYRSRLRDEGVDVGQATSSYGTLEFVAAIAEWVSKQDDKEKEDIFFITGKVWDGGTDKATKDAELLGESFAMKNGHAQHKFLGRVEVDYKDSRDGRSSDAPAHVAALDRFFAAKGEHYQTWWTDTPGVCMDAASVNFGEHAGSAALISQKPGGSHLHAEKAKAHQLELAAGEAWRSSDYLTDTWTKVTNKTIVHYNGSPKRQYAVRHFADFLGEHMVQIPNLHGVR